MPNRGGAQLDSVFRALADPTRRAVLERLSRGPAPVSNLAESYDMALPSFLQHLQVLEDCGLVRSKKAGRVRTCQLVQEFPNVGCYLEIVENERLVWTDALGPGYRPSETPFFTAVITLEPHANGTKYTALAMHKDEGDRGEARGDGLLRRLGPMSRPARRARQEDVGREPRFERRVENARRPQASGSQEVYQYHAQARADRRPGF